MKTTNRLVLLIFIHYLTFVFSYASANGVLWELASYRIRRMKKDETKPKIKDLLKLLDIGERGSLREKDSFITAQGALVLRLMEFYDKRDVRNSQMDITVKADGTIERVGGRVTKGMSKAVRKHIRRNCKLFKKGAQNIALAQQNITNDEVEIKNTYISKDFVLSHDGTPIVTVTADISWLSSGSGDMNFTRKIFTIDACNKTVIDVERHMPDVFDVSEEMKRKRHSHLMERHWLRQETPEPCERQVFGTGGNENTGGVLYGFKPHCLEPIAIVNETCFLQNEFIKVVDMNHSIHSDPDKVVNFRCLDGYNDTSNGGFSAALDTFYHATQTLKMYKEWYSFQPLKDTRALVHFDKQVNNAYWDGNNLLVGDGGENDTFPFSTLDTVAHELSHGVTERRSGLQFRGQPGAINDAFSDMAGEVAEFYVRGGNDWIVGGELTKADGLGIRYFDDPTRDGFSIGHMSQYKKGIDVHHSSGIINKAFYNVSQRLGVRDAFKPFLVANRMYWREKCDFEEAACDVIKAAYDTGLPVEMFQAAFQNVGLQLSECSDLNEFFLVLNTNETRNNLTVSRTVQPLYVVKPPSYTTGFEVTTSGEVNTTISLITSFLRDDTFVLNQGFNSLRHDFSARRTSLYLRLVVGEIDPQVISIEINFF